MNNNITSFIIISLIYTFLAVGCSSNSSSDRSSSSDTVTTATVKMSDTTSFNKSNGEKCVIYSDGTFCYPTAYRDKNTLKSLQKLYMSLVLDIGDSLELNDAMRNCVANSMHQYDMTQPEDDLMMDYSIDDSEPYLTYRASTTIQVHYNKNNLITFCKIDVVKKDSIVTSVTHKYYTVDLKEMKAVDVSQLVREDAQAKLTALLRSRLLEQNKVENNDQLNELGYYNIDNLIVTQNFFIADNGITWSYLPNKLAVSAVGEPQISLTFEELKPMTFEGSIINRIK